MQAKKVNVELPDGSKTDVVVRIREDVVDRVWEHLGKINDQIKNGVEDIGLINEYRAYLKEVAAKLLGIKSDDTAKMYADEIRKVTDEIEIQAKDAISFSQPSPSPQQPAEASTEKSSSP